MKVQQLAGSENKTGTGSYSGVCDLLVRPRTTAPDSVGVLVRIESSVGLTSATFQLEWSMDGTNFFAADAADAFSAMTANGGLAKSFAVKARYCRLKLSAFTGTSLVVSAQAITG